MYNFIKRFGEIWAQMIEENENYVAEDKFDYEDYDSSVVNRIKQAYICLMACMATFFMVIGVRNYWRIQ